MVYFGSQVSETESFVLCFAGVRTADVFLGTDVFGRNTFGGGRMNSCIGVEAAFSEGKALRECKSLHLKMEVVQTELLKNHLYRHDRQDCEPRGSFLMFAPMCLLNKVSQNCVLSFHIY